MAVFGGFWHILAVFCASNFFAPSKSTFLINSRSAVIDCRYRSQNATKTLPVLYLCFTTPMQKTRNFLSKIAKLYHFFTSFVFPGGKVLQFSPTVAGCL